MGVKLLKEVVVNDTLEYRDPFHSQKEKEKKKILTVDEFIEKKEGKTQSKIVTIPVRRCSSFTLYIEIIRWRIWVEANASGTKIYCLIGPGGAKQL